MADQLPAQEQSSAEHELSPVLAKYLDRHLVFPLLEFLQVRSRAPWGGGAREPPPAERGPHGAAHGRLRSRIAGEGHLQ